MSDTGGLDASTPEVLASVSYGAWDSARLLQITRAQQCLKC